RTQKFLQHKKRKKQDGGKSREKSPGFSPFYTKITSPLQLFPPNSEKNLSWTAWTARSASRSSTRTDTLISLVEIMLILMPALDRASNMRLATPKLFTMPAPTMDTLATWAFISMALKPM